jgi:hypothetical protein
MLTVGEVCEERGESGWRKLITVEYMSVTRVLERPAGRHSQPVDDKAKETRCEDWGQPMSPIGGPAEPEDGDLRVSDRLETTQSDVAFDALTHRKYNGAR